MTFDSDWHYESGGYAHGCSSRNAIPQKIFGRAALACIALSFAWTLYVNLAANEAGQIEFTVIRGDKLDVAGARADQRDVAGTRGDKLAVAAARGDQRDVAGVRGDKLAMAQPAPPAAAPAGSNFRLSLLDPRHFLGFAPGSFAKTVTETPNTTRVAKSAPVQSQEASAARAPSAPRIQQAQDVRSTGSAGRDLTQSAVAIAPASELGSPETRKSWFGARTHTDSVAESEPAKPTFFEKLFGKTRGTALAYASADDNGQSPVGRTDSRTAVYDISAHMVYMPDGTKLEAHSGLGGMLDDPRHAAAKNRGVTPPNVYDLELREAPFHGVRALRLIPVDDAKVFGRTGLLAHSFMLGPNGDSNGCVSFRNYDAFLHAYMNHEVNRLVVVAGQG